MASYQYHEPRRGREVCLLVTGIRGTSVCQAFWGFKWVKNRVSNGLSLVHSSTCVHRVSQPLWVLTHYEQDMHWDPCWCGQCPCHGTYTGKGQSGADNQSALWSENYDRKTANFMKLESWDNTAMGHSLFCKMFKELIYILPLVFYVTLKCVAFSIWRDEWQNKPWGLSLKSKSKENGRGHGWKKSYLPKL